VLHNFVFVKFVLINEAFSRKLSWVKRQRYRKLSKIAIAAVKNQYLKLRSHVVNLKNAKLQKVGWVSLTLYPTVNLIAHNIMPVGMGFHFSTLPTQSAIAISKIRRMPVFGNPNSARFKDVFVIQFECINRCSTDCG
jgi:hypothetical protein